VHTLLVAENQELRAKLDQKEQVVVKKPEK
jgi:hypothetical protein